MEGKKLLKTALWGAGAVLGVWFFVVVALPLTLPFVLAFVLAAVTEPAALYLMKKAGLSRPLAGGLCVLGIYALLAGILFLLGRTVLKELENFLQELPIFLESLSSGLEALRQRLTAVTIQLPDGVGTALTDMVEDTFSGTGLRELPGKLLDFVTRAAGKLPDFFLFLVTTVVASFLSAGTLPALRKWLSRALPGSWRRWVTTAWHRLKSATGGWFKAQLKLMGVTFVILTLGFMLLGVRYPFLFGAVVALVDMLPILGTGTVLIPWAMTLFLQGMTTRGVGFLLLYGVAAITRTSLEPRFIGKQMGLPPLLTLAAVYVGYRVAGLWGMILFPMAASLAGQLVKAAKKEL